MRPRRTCLVRCLPLVVACLAACDSTGPEAPGAIRIVVQPSGEDISRSGLRVSVANGPVRPLDSALLELTILGLPPGVHAVRLEGLAANCQVSGSNPVSVTVASSDTTFAVFNMSCAPRAGSVRVTTATTGADLDPDGYLATVVGGPTQAIPVNGTTTITNAREGQRLVTLNGVSPNCEITGADTTVVTVTLGGTVDVAFSLECVRFGTLEVTVSTTGVNLDTDGYTVQVRTESADFVGGATVAHTGVVTFPRLRPAADYRVSLQGLAANCNVTGSDTQTLEIIAGATTRATFGVVCQAPGFLALVRDNNIYVMRSNATDETRLTSDGLGNDDPAWSHSGRIAFTTTRHAGDRELYVMNDDGTNLVRLTMTAGADDSPSWSPDGQRIVFRSFRDVNSEIYVVNADGTGLTRLTNNAAEDIHPAWSSNDQIVFVSDRDEASGELYVMDADGSNLVRLTHNDSTEADPAWSPDGSMIAFARGVECYYGCSQDLFVMNADGSNVSRLATGWESYQDNSDPAWSPNGRAIAFTRQHCSYYGCQAPSVWLVDVPGTLLRVVTNTGANPTWKP